MVAPAPETVIGETVIKRYVGSRLRKAITYLFVFSAVLILGVLLGRWVTLSRVGRSVDWPDTFQSLAHTAQVMAFAVAGWWTYRLFVRQRMDQPRADVTHIVKDGPSNPHYRAVRVTVAIKNVGHVVISPPGATIQIDVPYIAENGSLTWSNEQCKPFDFGEYDLILEPGESHRYPFDFVVERKVEVVRVRTKIRVRKESTDFWDENSVHRLGPHAG
jgi:hypothetical protein